MINNSLLLKDKSILFAEDDIISRTETVEILRMLFNKVYSAGDGVEAYEIYENQSPDIILTDIKMPKRDGLSFIKKIRTHDYKTPIVLMTSFAEQELLIDAANLSVDGYLVKPVTLEKLTFSLCRALKRTYKNIELLQLSGNYFYNFDTKELYNKGAVVALGPKEHKILTLLIDNRDRTVTKNEIEKTLWSIEPVNSSVVRKLVQRIRQKINADIIVSVRGIGYRLETSKVSR
ncbi:MAG: response regulator transcription factor [Sulfurimonas sp.]|jgi:DNA-binding response OmpR family regulator